MIPESLSCLHQLRKTYASVCDALPWLDMAFRPQDPPAFPEYALKTAIAHIETIPLTPDIKGSLKETKSARGAFLLSYAPSAGPLQELAEIFSEMAREKIPLSLFHTDVSINDLEETARKYPATSFILESGPMKILYSFTALEKLLSHRKNVFLCTYNFCNWLGLERFIEKGLLGQLLFGTHRPRYNPHASMGPIAMGHFSWEKKCAIAGNNLRRLLEIPVKTPSEIMFVPPEPFIVDAHGHNGPTEKFPVPDLEFSTGAWRAFMHSCAIQEFFVTPAQALENPEKNPEELSRLLRREMPGCIRYFSVFFPGLGREHLDRIACFLRDPDCAGIKIHPSAHGVPADDPSYDPIYELAERHRRTIVTHSWDISPTNPVQKLSHPDRFRVHLKNHPEATLVLGHAGGRPGAMESVIRLCREFPRVKVDISGDYFDNGLLEKLVADIGVEKIIFGSDVNWIDPRTNLGPVLASGISDTGVLKILQSNARATFLRPE